MIKKPRKKQLTKITKAEFYFKAKIPYSIVPNEYLIDKELSLKAKGLLTIMYAHPDDWDFTRSGLQEISGSGKKQIESILNELKEEGYLMISKERNEKGQYAYKYIIFDRKQPYANEIF